MKKVTLVAMLIFNFYTFSQDVEIELFASGLVNPVSIKHAGDNRLFVVERNGLIQIINTNGDINMSPFLDINDRVINNGGEQGLLGLAFHPDYSNNGYFFVNYINNSGNTVISRFTRSSPASADENSELILLTISQPYSNHNGGDLAFGSDGFLYIATGDGGAGGDPQDRSQNLNTLLGKMLRIDVNTAANGNNYSIPASNPFVGNPNALDEIWAYGLRNPWKFSFDRDTNDLWIADVGQNVYEEINMVPQGSAGVNYGWRCYEANTVFDLSGNCPAANTLTFPVANYSHNNSGNFKCSITGGYRYRGGSQSSLEGLYFFADYCSNEIGYLVENGNSWTMSFTQAYAGNNWTCFGENVNGELYIAGISSGSIYRIIDANLSVSESDFNRIKLYPNPASASVILDLTNASNTIESIRFYDLQGKLVKTIKELENQIIEISTKELSKGMYFVKISSVDNKQITQKLLIN